MSRVAEYYTGMLRPCFQEQSWRAACLLQLGTRRHHIRHARAILPFYHIHHTSTWTGGHQYAVTDRSYALKKNLLLVGMPFADWGGVADMGYSLDPKLLRLMGAPRYVDFTRYTSRIKSCHLWYIDLMGRQWDNLPRTLEGRLLLANYACPEISCLTIRQLQKKLVDYSTLFTADLELMLAGVS